MIIGDLKNQSLEEILKGNALKSLQELHRSGDFHDSDSICKKCDRIYPRDDVLVYSSSKDRKVGVITSHSDSIKNLLSLQL